MHSMVQCNRWVKMQAFCPSVCCLNPIVVFYSYLLCVKHFIRSPQKIVCFFLLLLTTHTCTCICNTVHAWISLYSRFLNLFVIYISTVLNQAIKSSVMCHQPEIVLHHVAVHQLYINTCIRMGIYNYTHIYIHDLICTFPSKNWKLILFMDYLCTVNFLYTW